MAAVPVSEVQLSASAPVDQAERISSLDTLRGFALLGILLMNIVAMAMSAAAYDDPTVTGGSTGANLWTWIVMHVLAEGKMRCLFSMVFGASIILLTSRLERSGASSADIYYRRTLWLMLFGIVHAYLLWEGDILYPYALCALALYPFRNMPAKNLLIIGAIIALLDSGLYVAGGFYFRDMISKGQTAVAAEKSGKTLTEGQQAEKRSYEQWRKSARPTAEELKKHDEPWLARNPLKVIGARAKDVAPGHNQAYYSPMWGAWDIWSMMFIGMALFKYGVFSAQRSTRFYMLTVLAGYGIGITVNSWSAWFIVRHNFDPAMHTFASSSYDIGRLSVALGHMGVLMLLSKSGAMKWLTDSLGAIGQMAFSNYITHSVITAFLFTGYGFALYGKLQRYQIYYVVAAIWVFQMIVSPIWLRHFRFGPLEWCWRSLTYWKRQPMRRERAQVIQMTAEAGA